VVDLAQTTTALGSSVNPSVSGQSVTYTATVSVTSPGAGSPGGTVAFKDAGTTISTCATQSVDTSTGEATCTLSYAATAGSPHSITAVYGGDTNFATSTSSPLSQVVDLAQTTTALGSSVNPVLVGEKVTYTAVVVTLAPGSGTPPGSVTFMDNGHAASCGTLGVVSVQSGAADCSVTYDDAVPHNVVASYNGTASFTSSTSSSLTEQVRRDGNGYWLVSSSGGVFSYGDAPFVGSAQGMSKAPIVGIASTPDSKGYWLAASDGGVFSFGDANFNGSMGVTRLNAPIVGVDSTPDGGGYWEVASDGGIFGFGDAQFLGSPAAIHLNDPIVGMAPTPDGRGYWLVATDGGVFAYGDAAFFGSAGGVHLDKPVVGMAVTPDGRGYWLVATDGGVFAYGDAAFEGSPSQLHLAHSVVGMLATPDGSGYWLIASDGGVFSYGDAQYLGSTTGKRPAPIVGMG
jgi:hypothetical protein